MRFRNLLSLSVCAAILMLLPFQASAQSYWHNYRYGIHTGFLDGQRSTEVQKLGAGWVRVDLHWASVQPGGPNDWQFGVPGSTGNDLHGWLGNAQSRGQKLLIIVQETPS